MADVAMLDMDIPSPERSAHGHRIDCYALSGTDLSGYLVLVVPATVDQEYLARHREVIRRYLDGGGVLLFGGQILRDWLPGAARFVPLQRPSLQAYRVAELAPHPIFDGVEPDDLTFRRSVAGFFARGHHPPPPDAEVLVRLAGGEPTTYLDRHSTRGTIVVHASGDLLGYGGLPDSTAARLPAQFLAWARAEGAARRAGARGAGPAAAVRGPQQGGPAPIGPEPGGPAPIGPEQGHPAATGRSRGTGLAAVYAGSAQHHRALTTPKYARHLTGGTYYLPELADADLSGLDGLILPERMHRGLLTAAAGRVLELLDAGGTVVAFAGGEPPPEFLPGVRWEHRPTNYWWWLDPGADPGLRSPSPDHALFDHLTVRDCTWHHHGVLDPPEGVEVLLELVGGEALLYVDRVSTPGTLVVATLDPMSHYGAHFMPATERFLDGFLPWLSGATARSRR
jgi:hypothetical protein